MTDKLRLNILYTEIGRGHPFYLDGICDEIRTQYSSHIELNILDVFGLSRGVPLLLWKLVRHFYKKGSQGGFWGRLYAYVRGQHRPCHLGIIEKILARPIRNYLRNNSSPTVVAHPLLVPMISDIVDVYYQHGEISVPAISLVSGAKMIYAPLEETSHKFTEYGLPADRVVATGLCIEKFLVDSAELNFNDRLLRLNSGENLIGGFFSSGAEPIAHIEKMVKALGSLRKNGQMGLIFCRSKGEFESAIIRQFQAKVFETATDEGKILEEIRSNKILIFSHSDRQIENRNTQALFKYLDYFMSPSHERSNWALGLGIPMIILHPLIGPFSSINRSILLEANVAEEIISDDEADCFYEKLGLMSKSGKLLLMAKNGYGKYRIDGFKIIGNLLNKKICKN